MKTREKIIKRKFICYRDGLKIRGTIFRIDNKNDQPIAILSHEFMTNRFFTYSYAKVLTRLGYACFCFDFCGGGIISSSEGKSTNMSVLTEKEDLKAVIDFAKTQEYVDPSSIVLLGFSQGGFISALVAKEMEEELKGLVLLYPALTIPDDARKGDMLGMKFDINNIPKKLNLGLMRLSNRYVIDVKDIDAYKEISGYRGNILIIHGDKDGLVDISSSYKARDAYLEKGAKVRLEVIKGAKHIFIRRKYRLEAISLIEDFAAKLTKS